MKKTLALGIIGWIMATFGGSYKAVAQETPAPANKETQEVIIRKKGDKDTKVTVEITGDKVLINGKPIAEFNEDGVTINNRKMIIRDGNKFTMDFDGKMMDLDTKLAELGNLKNFDFKFDDNNIAWSKGEGSSYTFLGVNTEKNDDGAKILSVSEESPASKAGLEKGDIIYKIDDTKISSTSELSEAIRAKKEGDKVKVYYLRDGKKKDVKATLATQKSMSRSFSTMPDGSMRSLTVPRTPNVPRVQGMPRIYSDDMVVSGMNMRRQKLGLKIQDTEESNGVKVLDVESNSAAATAGLMKDDIITEIGGVKVSTTDDAREQLQKKKKESNAYTIKAKRNGSEMTFNVKIPKNLKTANL